MQMYFKISPASLVGLVSLAALCASSQRLAPQSGNDLKLPPTKSQNLEATRLGLGTPDRSPSAYRSIPTIETYGNKFFYTNNGSQFFIRGIAYQPDYSIYSLPMGWDHVKKPYIDPLAIPEICRRDIANLRALNVNTVRVYAIDPTADHDYCMNLLADNHIYVMADLSEPKNSIVREMPTWDVDLQERYTDVIRSLHKYNNVLGFFAGNEVITNPENSACAPFIRASVRDMKAFIQSKNYRKIPIGYSTNDDARTRIALKDYFVCGDDDSSRVDFLGVNNYEWCGHSTFRTSGYSERLDDFKDYPVPVFFSEFGCNTVRPRPFTEVDALFSPLMSNVFSGGIMYMYFEEANNYGIVQASNLNNVSCPVTRMEEFKFLQYQYGKVSPQGVNKKQYKPVKPKVECPSLSQSWAASAVLPSTPDAFKCDCVMSALACAQAPNVQLTVEDVKDVYGEVCNADSLICEKLLGDGSNGKYGLYASCRRSQRLSIAVNDYYYKNGQNHTFCDFNGKATTIGSRNSVADLKHINNGRSSDKAMTCYVAMGGHKYIDPLYGSFRNENETIVEQTTARVSHKTMALKNGADRAALEALLIFTVMMFQVDFIF